MLGYRPRRKVLKVLKVLEMLGLRVGLVLVCPVRGSRLPIQPRRPQLPELPPESEYPEQAREPCPVPVLALSSPLRPERA